MLDHVSLPMLRFTQLVVLCIASFNVGRLFQNGFRLPAITGYILTGIICGPFALALLSTDTSILNTYKRVEQGCLSIIGFTAGTELVLKELLSQVKAISLMVCVLVPTVTAALLVVTANFLPDNALFQGWNDLEKKASCLMVVSILLARSPASAIAVVKETRADGAFTKICVCASIVLDTCVVSLFSVNINFAHLIVDGTQLTAASALQPFLKLVLSIVAGYILKKILYLLVFHPTGYMRIDNALRFAIRGMCTFLVGVSTFVISDLLRDSKSYYRIDPLLACIACGALFANTTFRENEDPKFSAFMEESLPWTNIPFFTLVGCGMSFLGLSSMLMLVSILFLTRIAALIFGAYVASTLAGLPTEHNHLRWMGFITQAGVAIGLSKQAALEFPTWGASVQALCVTTILVNLLVGPVAFKWLLVRVGEVPGDDEAMTRVTQAAPGTPSWPSTVGSPSMHISLRLEG